MRATQEMRRSRRDSSSICRPGPNESQLSRLVNWPTSMTFNRPLSYATVDIPGLGSISQVKPAGRDTMPRPRARARSSRAGAAPSNDGFHSTSARSYRSVIGISGAALRGRTPVVRGSSAICDLPAERGKPGAEIKRQRPRVIQCACMHPRAAKIGRDQASSSARFMSQRPAPFPMRLGVTPKKAQLADVRLAEIELQQAFIAAEVIERIELDRAIADDRREGVIGQRQAGKPQPSLARPGDRDRETSPDPDRRHGGGAMRAPADQDEASVAPTFQER